MDAAIGCQALIGYLVDKLKAQNFKLVQQIEFSLVNEAERTCNQSLQAGKIEKLNYLETCFSKLSCSVQKELLLKSLLNNQFEAAGIYVDEIVQ